MIYFDRWECTLSILFSALTKIECIRIPGSNKLESDLHVREVHPLAPENELEEVHAILQLLPENIETPHPKFLSTPLAAAPHKWAFFYTRTRSMYFDVIRREKGEESSLELEIWGCKLDFGFVFWGVQGTRCKMKLVGMMFALQMTITSENGIRTRQ
jgi:hypothetical protein